ncbi:hypothetical protein Ade02nite_18900 [Paractinoplanes deccanensis]|uniref:Uncharacterized protein n=1 Tax=Paractinoplanes deccanensis TaxID=113561 RepID=A0ABQ3XZS3_9ACTN|nr:hypothetical protein [Actinoplanes deccanensis]GID73249.1 hypothetical protein Ade02nite_18900 [Actinoplanes deccanensis]
MYLDSTDTTTVPRNRQRLDGTPLTPTCEIPLKMCCGAVLLGEQCGCDQNGLFSELPDVFWDLRGVIA